MDNITWKEGYIQVPPPKKTKKITGTRFASILGLNAWSTPFEMWCEITKTYQKPFEDTIYTIAGKTIEPKQIEYMRKSYGMSNLRTPTDIYGSDYFKKTYGDFFKDDEIFGGMWDSLLVDSNEKPTTVIEFKTTKRSEDWAKGVPEYYALQASLYAYLLGVEEVIMVASFLEDKDYENPEAFIPSAENTITVEFNLHERYPEFERIVEIARNWWNECIVTGISPYFDEKKDAEILKALRTNSPTVEEDVQKLLQRFEEVRDKLTALSEERAELENEYKALGEAIKGYAISKFREGDTKVSITGGKYEIVLSKSISTEVDKERLEADGLLDIYSKPKTSYRMTTNKIKED